MTAEDWQKLQSSYTAILKDILEGKNLEVHLKDVESAIHEIETIIGAEISQGNATPGLNDIKNDFYYLKYEILERT